MNRLSRLLLAFCFLALWSCDSTFQNNNVYTYDIVIDYNKSKIDDSVIKRDSILFLFEKGFMSDTILIKSNDNIFENTFTTDPSLDAAGYHLWPNGNKVTSLMMRVNGGKNILIEIDSTQRIFTVNHLNRFTDSAKVVVKSMVSAPVYD